MHKMQHYALNVENGTNGQNRGKNEDKIQNAIYETGSAFLKIKLHFTFILCICAVFKASRRFLWHVVSIYWNFSNDRMHIVTVLCQW